MYVSTIAGTSNSISSHDGYGTFATFMHPMSLAWNNATGILYITDSVLIRQMSMRTGYVSSVATNSLGGMPVISVGSESRSGGQGFGKGYITLSPDHTYLYISDHFGCAVRRMALSSGSVSLVAGGVLGCGYADGIERFAQLNGSTSISADVFGNVFVTDVGNNKVRIVDAVSLEVKTLQLPGGVTAVSPHLSGCQLGGRLGSLLVVGDNAVREISYSYPMTESPSSVPTVSPSSAKASVRPTRRFVWRKLYLAFLMFDI
jgi:hypothetical protein